jgi:hypothetical protein
VSTKNSKAAVILDRCVILGPATAVFRFIDYVIFDCPKIDQRPATGTAEIIAL